MAGDYSSLVDKFGNRIKMESLTKEHAGPTVGGVRSIWHNTVAKNLDPAKLARILQAAADGQNDEYLSLAEEMEERDTHYSSVLGQRKRAISLIDPIVTGESDSDAIIEAVEELIAAPHFIDAIDDLLDGIAKGYACVEPIWKRTSDLWTPETYEYRDPRFFKFDRETGSHLLLKDDEFPEGKEVPLYSIIMHRPKLKSGLPVRGGLARLISWCFMLKSFTLQDWAAFLEVFGMPLRVGKYDDTAGADEKRTLLRAVRDLGSDAAAIIPQTMEVEFIEAKGGQGNAVFGAMADYLDKQISKAVIGQTMTTDDGSSLAQADVHADVKLDIKKSDARQLANTINRDLITPFVAINFGPNAPVPVLSFPVADPEDVTSLVDALSKAVPMGLEVSMNEVRKRIGFGPPDDGDKLMHAPKSQGASSETAPIELITETASACPGCGTTHLATEISASEPLVEEGIDQWERDMQPLVTQILSAANQSNGFDEFVKKLNGIDPDMQDFAKSLAIQAMKARGDGDLGNQDA